MSILNRVCILFLCITLQEGVMLMLYSF
ncbi:unnamed protein product [Larinioides sclopetarius]|uniref:Uncharacterized protein n=1 Tax=Larinioides sclopetarius TaxID=280406 RepID=A0AAV1YYZ0_9ARAC